MCSSDLCYLAQKGHNVTLIDQKQHMGGQFNLAMQIPGKEDFNHTLAYFTNELKRLNVTIELGKAFSDSMLTEFDDVVFATGVRPRPLCVYHPFRRGANLRCSARCALEYACHHW